ncbi:MAG TPA: phosphopantothenoylcysteine decarboxylase [Tepidisphaeraceae bacterium]|jgi:phosphopantothenate-cysteine ligase/phosphopantothenoylcysteine decarboxylase/phosphopantothenate--cysteine ligase
MPRFLVTAGNTREMIDRVRDWGNVFTGNTGYGIARALAERGSVDLLTSNSVHAAEAAAHGIGASTFRTHADLDDLLRRCVTGVPYDAIFMTAAVADYRPTRVYSVASRESRDDGSEVWVVRDAQAGKVKSDHPAVAVLGERTEKLVDKFRRDWGFGGTLVKFKLEVGVTEADLLATAERSRVASGANYLVANTLDMVRDTAGETGGRGAGAFLLAEGTHEWVPRDRLAERLADLVTK